MLTRDQERRTSFGLRIAERARDILVKGLPRQRPRLINDLHIDGTEPEGEIDVLIAVFREGVVEEANLRQEGTLE
jgi:hypothetical protein